MSDLLHGFVDAALHALARLVGSISPSRLGEMPAAWAWLAAACLAAGSVAFIAAACTGLAWLFDSFLALLLASLGLLCLGAFRPRPARGDRA